MDQSRSMSHPFGLVIRIISLAIAPAIASSGRVMNIVLSVTTSNVPSGMSSRRASAQRNSTPGKRCRPYSIRAGSTSTATSWLETAPSSSQASKEPPPAPPTSRTRTAWVDTRLLHRTNQADPAGSRLEHGLGIGGEAVPIYASRLIVGPVQLVVRRS